MFAYRNIKVYVLISLFFMILVFNNLTRTRIDKHAIRKAAITAILSNQTIHNQVCIVTRTYQKQYSYLLTHLLSISHNPLSKPLILVVVTDETSSRDRAQSIVTQSNTIVGYNMTHLLPIFAADAERINPNYKSDFGFSYTDAAINYIIQNKSVYECSHFIFTNGDNLYTNEFIDEYITPDIIEGADIIGFNFVSRYRTHDAVYNNRKSMDSYFVKGAIDLGAFAIRVEVIEKYPEMRFVKQTQAQDAKLHEGDGAFIEYAASKRIRSRIHRQILFVHQ